MVDLFRESVENSFGVSTPKTLQQKHYNPQIQQFSGVSTPFPSENKNTP